MRTIYITVQNEFMSLSSNNAGAAGSYGVVTLEISFGSGWEAMTKKLYFYDAQGKNAVYVLLGPTYLKSGETDVYQVPIPAEPLAYEGDMTLTIKGVDGTDAVIYTASKKLKVMNSSYSEGGSVPAEPTATQAEQLQSDITALQRLIALIDGTVDVGNVTEVVNSLKLSNRNLLHNGDFRNPVNQRGQTSYSGTGVQYTVDRWVKRLATATLELVSGGVKLTGDGQYSWLLQSIENFALLANKTVTLSINVKELNGSADIVIGNGTSAISIPGNGYGSVAIAGSGITTLTVTLPDTFTNPNLNVGVRLGDTIGEYVIIESIKLELGSVSTLANDPPDDFGERLALCKRFYRLWTTDAARTEALKEVGLMRTAAPTTGTVVIGGVTYYYASSDL